MGSGPERRWPREGREGPAMVITVRRNYPWFPVALAIGWVLMMSLAVRDLGRRSASGNCRRGPAAAQAELPYQLVGRRPGDPHPLFVDAEEVVGGTEAEQIRFVVAAALGPIFEVMHVRGGAAAPWDLAAMAVAAEDPHPLRHSDLEMGLPDGDEVLRHLHQAHSQGNRSLGERPHHPERLLEEVEDIRRGGDA